MMPDVPYPKEPEEAKADQFVQALWGAGGAVGAVTRKVVTGDATGRLRRKGLFLLGDIGIIVALVSREGVVGLIAGSLALIALLLLAMTDDDIVVTQVTRATGASE